MKRYQLLHVNSPLVEMECGGVKIQSEPIKDAKENPNFPKPVLSFDAVSPEIMGETLFIISLFT